MGKDKSEECSNSHEKYAFHRPCFLTNFAGKSEFFKECMMNKTYRQTLALLLLLFPGIQAIKADSGVLTLDSCRNMAVGNNKELRMTDMQKQAAYYNRKSAFTTYLPKVSATGIYMHTGKELSLLSDDQKATLPHIGDAFSMPELNQIGQGLVDALHTDTRNMAGAAVVLTQPLYMGGKLRAYNNISRFAEQIADDKHNLQYQNLIVAVDETYWNIVQLCARKRLAESYLELVKKLDDDISRMIAEGLATKADGLSVKVKVNEANVSIIQVDNGIDILKMRLCQLCGLPQETQITLADETYAAPPAAYNENQEESDAWERRPELSALGASVKIHDEKIKLARSEFLPTAALTGGYFANYPSVFNSFEKKFKGTWNIGVAVNIPVVTWGDRNYKVKAARAESAAARFEFEESREKIELQVSQSRQKLREARERYSASLSSQDEADENLRYATLGLKEGVLPVSNVLEAQTAWLQAKANLISADIDLRLAFVYLKKALGTIR